MYKKNISVFSFYAGTGILDLAFERSGFKIVFVNEVDPVFLDSYRYARHQLNIPAPKYGYSNKSAEYYGKRKGKSKLKILMEEQRDIDRLVGFIGGPPCPDFSIAGKNAGVKGKNGKLTKTYFDIICRCKPDFFLFENVKGLVKTKKHKKFLNEMKYKLSANGYITSERVVNSLEYGVPQFRERVFMIGVRDKLIRGHEKKYVDNLGSLKFDWTQNRKYDIDDVMRRNWPGQDPFVPGGIRNINRGILKKLTVQYWFEKNDVNGHPNATDCFKVGRGIGKISSISEGDVARKSFKRLHRWRFSPTAAYGNNEVHLHPYEVRRISVAEAMAIQTLPKDFELPPNMSLTKKFKTVGNGVPYLMAKGIAKSLKVFLDEIQEDYNEDG